MYFVLKILKILFTLFRSTCFGHHCVHHQELFSCTCSLWSLSIIRIHVVYKYILTQYYITSATEILSLSSIIFKQYTIQEYFSHTVPYSKDCS